MSWFQKLLRKQKNKSSYMDICKELRLQYDGKHIVYDPINQAISYRNVISPTCAGMHYPGGFFLEKTETLSSAEAKQCSITIEHALSQLPLYDGYDLLPPGASHKCLLIFTKQDGGELCYSNAHLTENQFAVTTDPVHQSFLTVFNMLCTFCSFPEYTYFSIPAQPKVQTDIDQRYFEETLWMCPKCSVGNRMGDRYCIKCGEYRGW